MARPHVSFPWILPLLSLTVWLFVIGVPFALIFSKLLQASKGTGDAIIYGGQFSAVIPRHQFLSWSLNAAAVRNGHFLAAVNIPGFRGEFVLSVRSWPRFWHPAGLTMEAWRAIVLPAFCLPAWWFVGRGMDAAIGWRRIHWTMGLAGMVLTIFFVVLACGLAFGLSESEREGMVYPIWGFAVWAAAFGILPYAWVRERRRRVV